MRKFLIAGAAVGTLFIFQAPAMAAGCASGAAVGGVAGHVAGHHGVMGAAAGCAVGHHEANKQARASSTGTTAPAPNTGAPNSTTNQ